MASKLSRVAVLVAAALAAFGVALASYWPVLGSYFLSDDFILVGDASRGVWLRSWGPFLRPLVVLSYALDYRLWGFAPLGFHLTNILLHTAAALAVGALAWELGRACRMGARTPWLSGCAVGLFLVLPCHSEVVSWISGRGDALATLFGVGALAAFVRYVSTGDRLLIGIASGAFAAALLSKEPLVTLPGAAVALGGLLIWLEPRARSARARRVGVGLLFFAGVLCAYFAARWIVLGTPLGPGLPAVPLSVLLANGVRSAVRVVLSPDMILAALGLLRHTPVLLATSAAALLACFAIARHVKREQVVLAAALLLCFGLALLPTLPIGVSLSDTQGERHLYYPSAFACLGLPLLAFSVWRESRVAVIPLALYGVFCVFGLRAANANWATAGELSHAVASAIATSDTGSGAVVVNVPDNFRGAYVLRNGLKEAVTTFSPGSPVRELRLLVRHSVPDLEAPFRVTSDGPLGRHRLCGFSKDAVVVPLGYRDSFVTIGERVGDCVGFEVRNLPPGLPVFVFSRGRLTRADHSLHGSSRVNPKSGSESSGRRTGR